MGYAFVSPVLLNSVLLLADRAVFQQCHRTPLSACPAERCTASAPDPR
jgi:hypothetical protein